MKIDRMFYEKFEDTVRENDCIAARKPDEAEAVPALKTYLQACATNDAIRHIIESGPLTDLATNPVFSTKDFRAVPAKYRALIPEYNKDYVSLNQFAA